jgi:hypothetical protein
MQEYLNVRSEGIDGVVKLVADINEISKTTKQVTAAQGEKVLKIFENVDDVKSNVAQGGV